MQKSKGQHTLKTNLCVQHKQKCLQLFWMATFRARVKAFRLDNSTDEDNPSFVALAVHMKNDRTGCVKKKTTGQSRHEVGVTVTLCPGLPKSFTVWWPCGASDMWCQMLFESPTTSLYKVTRFEFIRLSFFFFFCAFILKWHIQNKHKLLITHKTVLCCKDYKSTLGYNYSLFKLVQFSSALPPTVCMSPAGMSDLKRVAGIDMQGADCRDNLRTILLVFLSYIPHSRKQTL